jgi:hypothetical protein
MAYGTLKVDNITYTSGGSDASTSVSGLVQGNFPNITITGTISGTTITGDTGQFTTITAVTGIFTTTLSGNTVTGGTAGFTTITGQTVTGGAAGFTTITGQTVTGGTAGFTTITGQTVTGALAEFTSGTVKDLVITNSLVSPSGTDFSVAGNLVVGGSGFFGSGISVTGQVSGQTVTGTAAAFGTVTGTTVTGTTANFVTVSGTTVTGTTANFVTVSGTTVTGGSINDSVGNVRNIPQNAQGSTYTLVASDAGKHIFAENTVTVPSGVFSVGQAVSIYNNTAGDITISGAAGITLRNAGTADTGNRTLAQRGLATILCVSGSVDFVINGGGLS